MNAPLATETVMARQFEGELWVRAADYQRLQTVRNALKAAVKWLPDDIQQDVMTGDTTDAAKWTDDYKNDHASMVAGWRLL